MLDGTGRDPPNPTYTCVVKLTPRGQYIIWKNALRKKIGTSEQKVLRRKPYKLKEEPEKGGSEEEKQKEEDEETERNKREESKKEKCYYSLKKNIRETDPKPETGLRGDLGGKCYS